MPVSRSRTCVPVFLALLLAVLMVSPATAQENYPPSEPPGQSVQVDCDVDAVGAARQVECEGQGFAPGTQVTLRVFAAGGGGSGGGGGGNQPVASGASTVRPDGTFDVSAQLDCTYDRDKARAVVEGEARNGRQVTHSEVVDVPSCEVLGLGLSGDVDGEEGIMGLALTGQNLLLLLLVAAALIAAGTLLVRNRRRNAGATTA